MVIEAIDGDGLRCTVTLPDNDGSDEAFLANLEPITENENGEQIGRVEREPEREPESTGIPPNSNRWNVPGPHTHRKFPDPGTV